MKILIIEDQKNMLGFLEKGLREKGYSIDSAQSGEAGEVLAYENTYDLIILDIMLPSKNGMDVARTLRQEGYSGPLLMLTALSRTKDKIRGLDSGADDYLTKPFAFEELLARIRALLRRNTSQSSTQLTYADIDLDILNRKVTRNSMDIELTPKEYALLEYFLRNPEKVISRTELGEHIWDMNFDPKSNVIDAYMSMLRKKIDGPFETKLFHTIKGAGYVLRT